MKRIILANLCLWLGLVLTASSALAENNWILAGSSDGVDSYYRTIEGSNITQIRAITIVNSRIEVIGEVLRDIPAGPKWRPNCIKSEIIKKFNRNDMLSYHISNLPWPASDRDVLVQNKTFYDVNAGRAVIDIWSTKDPSVPVKDGYVRVPEFRAKYVLEYITRDKTGIVFTTSVDPGGWIPAFFANFFTRYYASQEVKNLGKIAKTDKYINLAKGSEEETLVESLVNSESKSRKIFITRLEEFINDQDFIKMIADNVTYDELFSSTGEEFSRILLYGWGSVEGKKKAIEKLLEDYLRKSGYDQTVIKKLTGDKALVQLILDGKNKSDKTVPEIIKEKAKSIAALEEKSNMAAKNQQ